MSDSSSKGHFDGAAVVRAVWQQPLVDDRGASHFPWLAGYLVITPMGPVATCDVVMVSSAGALVYRRLSCGTTGATLLALALRRLTLAREVDVDPMPAADTCERLIAEFPFDESVELPRARKLLGDVGVDFDAIDSRVPQGEQWPIGDPLYPAAVTMQLSLAGARLVDTSDDRRWAVVQWGNVGVGYCRPSGPVASMASWPPVVEGLLLRPTEEDLDFDLPPAAVLLLIAIHEGLACAAALETKFGDVFRDAFRILDDLRDEVIAGLDVHHGYQVLIGLCDPTGQRVLDPDASPEQQLAFAMLAMRKWRARHGRATAGQSVDVDHVAEIAGRGLELVDDRHVLRFERAMITFDVEDDLAVGWALVIDENGSLSGSRFAFSAVTLEYFVWACAMYDLADGELRRTVAEYLDKALSYPWIDASVAAAAIKARLDAMRDRMNDDDARILGLVLGRGLPRDWVE